MHVEEGVKSLKKAAARFFFVLALLIFVGSNIGIVLAVKGIVEESFDPVTSEPISFSTGEAAESTSWTDLNLTLMAMDVVERTVTISVRGYRKCIDECPKYKEKLILFSAGEDDATRDDLPPSISIDLPNKSETISQDIKLPVFGNVLFYPFDEYSIILAAVLHREFPDGKIMYPSPKDTSGYLYLALSEELARVKILEVLEFEPKELNPLDAPFSYAYATGFVFERPIYLIVLVSLVLLLFTMVNIFVMVTKKFEDILTSVAGLLLSVWGVRTLILGMGFPVDVTLVDMILICNLLYMLMVLTFRGMNQFHRVGSLKIFPWALPPEPEPKMRECPECLTKVLVVAKRCGSCGVTIEAVK